MQPSEWQKIKSVFYSALEVEECNRAAYVAKACDRDDDIRRKVEELLASYRTSFLENDASSIGPADQPDQPLLKPGMPLGHFEIVKPLGSGGMGQVYLARDGHLDRQVAIKVFSPELTRDGSHLGRFVREARAASALNHPSICTIHEINPEHDPPFIAMEYVDGETLAQKIADGKLETGQVIDITLQTAEALAEAHDAGIVHRDIKPANILINKRGKVKIVDFGLAKKIFTSADDITERQLTHSGMIVGTVRYMSPEQARGMEIDRRTDLWSLGVVLYEMLSGRLPFDGGSTSDAIAAILKAEPSPIELPDAPVSDALNRMIGKTLAKDKDARYPTAHHLIADLHKVKDKLSRVGVDAAASDHPILHDQTTMALDHETDGTVQKVTRPSSEKGLARSRSTYYKVAAALLILIAASSAVAVFYIGRAASKPIDSIAVMPFLNQTGNPESEYLSDGITESLIGRLSEIPDLSVKARSTVFRFKGKDLSIKDIGRELNVPAILTGRVARRDNRFSLYIELVDAASENVMWRAEYYRPESSLATIPGEIARDVANNLRSKLPGAAEQKVIRNYTDNAAAYELYLKGRFYWDKRNEESYKVAEDAYKQAIALDPNYALAYAGLADCYLFREAGLGRHVAMPKAKEYALKALELDETLAEAHTTVAFVAMNYEFDIPGGEREFLRAIELKPNYAIARQFYGSLLVATGRFDEALSQMRKAVELEPYTAAVNWSLGMGLGLARRYDEAIAQLQRTLQIQPNYALAEGNLTGMYIQTGRFDDAMTLVQKHLSIEERREGALSSLAIIHIRTGGKAEALKVLKEITGGTKAPSANSAYGIARVYAALGDKDEAFRWLNTGYEKRAFSMFFLRVDPFFDSLHDDPRFDELIRRIGLKS